MSPWSPGCRGHQARAGPDPDPVCSPGVSFPPPQAGGAVWSARPPAPTWRASRTASACLGPGGPEPPEGVRQGESLEGRGGADGPVTGGPAHGCAQMLVPPSCYLLTPSCGEAAGCQVDFNFRTGKC